VCAAAIYGFPNYSTDKHDNKMHKHNVIIKVFKYRTICGLLWRGVCIRHSVTKPVLRVCAGRSLAPGWVTTRAPGYLVKNPRHTYTCVKNIQYPPPRYPRIMTLVVEAFNPDKNNNIRYNLIFTIVKPLLAYRSGPVICHSSANVGATATNTGWPLLEIETEPVICQYSANVGTTATNTGWPLLAYRSRPVMCQC